MPTPKSRVGEASLYRSVIVRAKDGSSESAVFSQGFRVDRREQLTTGDMMYVSRLEEKNGVKLHHLNLQWQSNFSATEIELDESRFAKIEEVIIKYIEDRVTFEIGVKAEELESAKSTLLRGLKQVMSALDDFGAASIMLREQLVAVEHPPINMDDAYPVITALRRRIHLLESITDPPNSSNDAFLKLTQAMRDLWEETGMKVSVAKSSRAGYANPSPFVRFMSATLRCVPAHLRQHSQSEGALAKAIYEAVRRRDANETATA